MIHADPETCRILWLAGSNMTCVEPSVRELIIDFARDFYLLFSGVLLVLILCMFIIAVPREVEKDKQEAKKS